MKKNTKNIKKNTETETPEPVKARRGRPPLDPNAPPRKKVNRIDALNAARERSELRMIAEQAKQEKILDKIRVYADGQLERTRIAEEKAAKRETRKTAQREKAQTRLMKLQAKAAKIQAQLDPAPSM